MVAPPTGHTFGVRRVTARELSLVLRGVRLVSPAGLAVARLDATDDPEKESDDDEVTLVAVDSGSGQVLTNFGLFRAGTWGAGESELGTLAQPTDAAIDRAGRVLVSDTGNRRVVLLQHDGRSLTPVRAFGGFQDPRAVAADGRGGFYVCDRALNAVVHLDTASGKRTTFGLEVAFDRPVAVATVPEGDRLARGAKRVVVIADRDGRRLRSFGVSGTLRATRETASLGDADVRFEALDIDYYGNIWAVDRNANALHKLRDDLYPLDAIACRGTEAGCFLSPRGIAIHRRFGQIFIAEEDGGQYLWVGTDLKNLVIEEQGGGITIAYVLTEDSALELKILDPQGRDVALLFAGEVRRAGPHRVGWDGTDATGRPAADGRYLLEARARATYASRATFERKVLKTFFLRRDGNGTQE